MFNKKKIGTQKQFMSIALIFFLTLALISSSKTVNSNPINKISHKILGNMVILSNEDFNINSDDINSTYMQLKDSPDHTKARILAAKWAKLNANDMNYKPYHVKSADENIADWKNYLVLMMGKKDHFILKKVCFNSEFVNFGFVLDTNQSCGNEVILRSY